MLLIRFPNYSTLRVASFTRLAFNSFSSNLKSHTRPNMPKDPKHITDSQRQRVKIKERVNKYAPSKVTLQVLGTGAEGAPRCLYVFSDQSRYLFNCSEGTQRLAHEHKMKLAKLEHIFITQASWKNMGGLPGTALTIQDVGVPEITLHGPAGLIELFNATKKFVIMKNMKVQMANCVENTVFEDSVMSIKYVPIAKTESTNGNNDISATHFEIGKISEASSSKATIDVSKKRRRSYSVSSNYSSYCNEDDTDYYAHESKKNRRTQSCSATKRRPPLESIVLTDSMKCLLSDQKNRAIVMNYICRLKPRAGALNLDKCVQLNVPAGPKLGELKSGKSVVLSDGTVITPEQVCEPEEPGPVFLIVDCPSEDYLDALISSNAISQHQQSAKIDENLAFLVVHFTPANIAEQPKYLKWIDAFSPSTHHLFLNDKNTCMGSIAVHRIQYKLNLLNKEFFPILGDRGTVRIDPNKRLSNMENGNRDVSLSSSSFFLTSGLNARSFIQPGTFFNFHLRPRLGQDDTTEIKLIPSEYVDETYNLDGFCDELGKLRFELSRRQKNMFIRPYPKLLFLGTGSCIPNKTRNTSGLLLFTDENSNILVDCGEGTYGQIIRFFGEREAINILAKTDGIYISHLHADHHIGLIGYLQGRRRARAFLNLPEKPLYLLAPQQIKSWLNFYDLCFEDINQEYELIPNGVLIKGRESIMDDIKNQLVEALNLQDIATCAVRHCPNAFGVTFKYNTGYKITYSGDTMPCEELIALGMNSNLLIHEATMEDELANEAVVKMHSTTSQAIRVGQRMKAQHILLTHFSQRYAKLPRFNKNFTENVGIAFDNMMISVDAVPLLPLLNPSLKLMFAEHYEDMESRTMKRAKRERMS